MKSIIILALVSLPAQAQLNRSYLDNPFNRDDITLPAQDHGPDTIYRHHYTPNVNYGNTLPQQVLTPQGQVVIIRNVITGRIQAITPVSGSTRGK